MSKTVKKKAVEISDKESFLRAHFPPRSFIYKPEVPYAADNEQPKATHFEVRPLRNDEVHRVTGSIVKIAAFHYLEGMSGTDLVEHAHEDVIAILDLVTTIKGAEHLNISVGELSIDCLAPLMDRLLQHLSPKNWEALGTTMTRQFGLGPWLADIKEKLGDILQSIDSTKSEPSV